METLMNSPNSAGSTVQVVEPYSRVTGLGERSFDLLASWFQVRGEGLRLEVDQWQVARGSFQLRNALHQDVMQGGDVDYRTLDLRNNADNPIFDDELRIMRANAEFVVDRHRP